MPKYRDIPMRDRIDKIGELLAKGVYLYIQKQKEEAKKNETKQETSCCQTGRLGVKLK